MQGVRPKKFLGQHFLKDKKIAQKIVEALSFNEGRSIIEIGPGTGVLTQILVEKKYKNLVLIEIDKDSIQYLKEQVYHDKISIIEGDFLKLDLEKFVEFPFSIIGNFPYNISSQIFFKILESRSKVDEIVCMIQKEVAQRICAPSGNKTYGILSVLLGAFFHTEMLFKVPPGVFHPPPKVESAVIRLKRNDKQTLPCDESLFFKIVKQGFQNRRKTLRNALKPIFLPEDLTAESIFNKRAEQLSVDNFIELTFKIQTWKTL